MTRIRTPAHVRAQSRYQARIRELRPVMLKRGWVYRAGCWVPRKG